MKERKMNLKRRGRVEQSPQGKAMRKGKLKVKRSTQRRDRRCKLQEAESKEDATMVPSASRPREEGPELSPAASPAKVARLYPPHFAGIQAIEVHGDEEFE